jgi:LysR family transcriptional activator of nhaA
MNISNYNHLFYFYITAKLEGVTAAAKYLNTSQSSLSIQINTLEETLGKDLFHKAGRRMELTDTGRELYQYCRRAFDIFNEMFDQLDKNKSSMGVRLSIGVSLDIERPFVADVLSKVSKQYQKSERPLINLTSLPSNHLSQLLQLGELDLLLTTEIGDQHQFETIKEFSTPIGAFASYDLIKNIKKYTLESLIRDEKIPVVLPSKRTDLRTEIDQFLLQKKINPTCVFDSNVLSSVIRTANDGLGMTLLPYIYVLRELRSERLIDISNKKLWDYKMTLFTSKNKLDESKKKFTHQFIQQLDELIKQNLPTNKKGKK